MELKKSTAKIIMRKYVLQASGWNNAVKGVGMIAAVFIGRFINTHKHLVWYEKYNYKTTMENRISSMVANKFIKLVILFSKQK